MAYTGQLDQQAAGEIQRVDVSGSLGHGVCVADEAPPAGAPLKLTAIVGEQPAIVANVNTILPQPFLATLETFLERILPLYDDGTMDRAIAGIGSLLGEMAADPRSRRRSPGCRCAMATARPASGLASSTSWSIIPISTTSSATCSG